MKKNIIIILLLLIVGKGYSQEIPEHISSIGIYEFIDELSIIGIIEVNDVVKPYSDRYIYSLLLKQKKNKEKLTNRQKKELQFYIKEFSYLDMNFIKENSKIPFIGNVMDKYGISLNPIGYRYRDSLFYVDIRPIWGIKYFKNSKNSNFHRWGGGALKMSIGDHFSAFASIRDNNVSEIFSRNKYFIEAQGGAYKGRKKGGGDFSEMRGGIAYSWDWGSISMVKDHVEWGTNYHGANIFSTKAPSFAQLKLHLKPTNWFDFNYMHGWLVSNVIDSTRSYTTDNGNIRDVMHPKYVAANMFTIKPIKGICFSFGNSIIYSDLNPHPAFLIPFLFYKSIDHWLNNTDGVGKGVGQNSQMFANISIYSFKNFHIYASIFVDELKVARIKEKGKYNLYSYKIGMKNSNSIIKDLSLNVEYTRTTPGTYLHYISTTTFESNGYNMGHYLRENSDELYFSITFKPIFKLTTKLEYSKARHGNSFPYNKGSEIITHPFMQEVRWSNEIISLLARYEFAYNSFLNLSYQYNNAKGEDLELFTPNFYQGKNNTFSFGVNFGF